MRQGFGFLVLGLAFFLATWIAWWMVPLVGLLWGGLRPLVRRPAVHAAGAAALAWGGWLLVDAVAGAGALGVLAGRLGGVMELPRYALFTLTLIFPAVLALSATTLGGALADLFFPRSGKSK